MKHGGRQESVPIIYIVRREEGYIRTDRYIIFMYHLLYTIEKDSLVWIAMKDVASCDKLGGAACRH